MAMATATITLNQPFDLQENILLDRTRFRVLAIGRRWGKTETILISMVNRLIAGQRLWFCSPTHRNNKRVFPQVKNAIAHIPDVYINNSDLSIRLFNGGQLEFVSLHEPDNLRGEGLDHIFIDEAAFIKPGIFDRILRPMLVTSGGGATLSSSPNGTGNDFHAMYLRGLDENEPDWTSYHYPSHTSPFVPDSELADIQRNTTERVFKQEYMAQFLDDGGAVFRNLQACVIDKATRKGSVVFGVDWGKENDYTVITAMDRTTGNVLEIDRFNQIGWSLQRGRLKAMYERYKPDAIWAERNSIGDPNIEALMQEGLPMRPFDTTAKSKPPLIESLALAFEQTDIGIPDDKYLLGELQAYTMAKTASGNYKYSAPDGLHDDIVMSLALSWHGVKSGSMILFMTD